MQKREENVSKVSKSLEGKKLVISESSQTDVRNDKSVKSGGFVAIGWQSLARFKKKKKKSSMP